MATAGHIPPPPTPPPSCGEQPSKVGPPRPQYAALPFQLGFPIQETGDQAAASHDLQEDAESEDGKKEHPVQETDPAPQTQENHQLSETTSHDEGIPQMDEDDVIQSPGSAMLN